MKKWKCPKELRPFLPLIKHTPQSITKVMNGEQRNPSRAAAEAQLWLIETLVERGLLIGRAETRLRKEAVVSMLLRLTGCQDDEKSIKLCTKDTAWLLERVRREYAARFFKAQQARVLAVADMLEKLT